MSKLSEDRKYIQALLRSPETYATTLFALAWDAREEDEDPPKGENPAWLEWLPTHVIQHLEEGYRVNASPIAVQKMAVAQRLVLTNDFYRDKRFFIQACNVLSGSPSLFSPLDPADSYEITWGIYEGMNLWQDEERDESFDAQIQGYIKFQMEAEGISADYVLRGEIAVPGQFGGGDPMIEEAFGAAALENAKELQRWLATEIREYRQQIDTVPLRHRVEAEAKA